LKNKLVFGFNKKVIWLYIAILLCLCFSIWGVVVYAKNQNWLKMSIFIFFTVFCIFGLIIFFIKNIKFTKNYFRFGTENGWVKDKEGNTDYANKPAKARWFTTKLYYNQNTKIGVHLKSRNIFWTGWKLSPNQLEYNGLT